MAAATRWIGPLVVALAIGLGCAGWQAQPQDPGAAAAAYAAQGRLAEAVREAEIALRTHPRDVRLLRQTADLYLRIGAPAKAASALEAATRAAPADVDVWLAYAEVETGRGMVDSAYVAYRQAVRLAPENRRALAGFAGAAERAGILDEAKQARRRLQSSLAPVDIPPVAAGDGR
jgi:cytochrome c-type biogenesis protein CcmH/NrfG